MYAEALRRKADRICKTKRKSGKKVTTGQRNTLAKLKHRRQIWGSVTIKSLSSSGVISIIITRLETNSKKRVKSRI